MKNLFEKIMGKSPEKEKRDPVAQAKDALDKYLLMLDENTGSEAIQKEGMENVEAREKSILDVESIDEIRTMVKESIDLLNQGDLKRAMSFLNAREANLRNYYVCEDYFSDAANALRGHINSELEAGNFNIEDMSTITLELKAGDKIVGNNDLEVANKGLSEDITLYLIPSGKIVIKRADDSIEIENTKDSKWAGFFNKK